MNFVPVRNLRLGEGTPKICIPLVSPSDEALFEEAKALSSYPADLAEWRADYMAVSYTHLTLPTNREV